MRTFLWLLALGLLWTWPARAQELPWQAEFEAWKSALPASFTGTHLGFQLIRLRDGLLEGAYQADKGFVPASTMKVLTAHRILASPKAQDTLPTEVWLSSGGDLTLVGGGDPELSRQDLKDLAAQVAAGGLKEARGLRVDPGPVAVSVSAPLGNGWAWDDATEDYSAEICPLTVDRGFLRLALGSGAPPAVTLPPELGGLPLQVIPQPQPGWHLERRPGQAGVFLVGSGPGAGEELDLAFADPDLVAGRLFREALQAAGVMVSGEVVRGQALGRVLATHRSRPVSVMLREALARSDNLAMELLLRATTGLEAALDEAPRVVDASGLSRYNTVRPQDLTRALLDSKDLRALLPLMGEEGTLAHRLQQGPAHGRVRAKTGTMSGVSTLAGTLLFDDPQRATVFALMVNGYVGPMKEVKAAEDALVERLVNRLSSAP